MKIQMSAIFYLILILFIIYISIFVSLKLKNTGREDIYYAYKSSGQKLIEFVDEPTITISEERQTETGYAYTISLYTTVENRDENQLFVIPILGVENEFGMCDGYTLNPKEEVEMNCKTEIKTEKPIFIHANDKSYEGDFFDDVLYLVGGYGIKIKTKHVGPNIIHPSRCFWYFNVYISDGVGEKFDTIKVGCNEPYNLEEEFKDTTISIQLRGSERKIESLKISTSKEAASEYKVSSYLLIYERGCRFIDSLSYESSHSSDIKRAMSFCPDNLIAYRKSLH